MLLIGMSIDIYRVCACRRILRQPLFAKFQDDD
jgi:hypothetical protein